jgi:predicted peptidase
MPFATFLRCAGSLLCLLAIFAAASFAGEVTKDDVDFRKKVYVNKKGERLSYRLYVPVTYSKEIKYPLVLWLHGGAGRGSDNVAQISKGNSKGTHFWISPQNQANFPALVFAPQCPMDDNWADPELNQPGKALVLAIEALDALQKEFSVDPDRVYLAGQSMGGLGVYALLQLYPERWAAGMVMCAYDNFTNTLAISRVPVWVFQGDADQTVPIDLVREMMKQLRKVHANLRYTEYHGVDHEVWDKAFAEPELLPWLSGQKRGQTAPATSPGPAGGQVGSSAPPANH